MFDEKGTGTNAHTRSAAETQHPSWLTTSGAAAYLGLSRKALYQSVRRGQIKAHRLGRRLRFRQADLDAALTAPTP